jgi:hypothetical protein
MISARGVARAVTVAAMVMVVVLAAGTPVCASADIQEITVYSGYGQTNGVLDPEPYGMWVAVTGTGLSSVTMTPPGKSPISLVAQPPGHGPGNWLYGSDYYATLTGLRADLPLGQYAFSIDGGGDSVVLTVGPTAPSGFASITYPSPGETGVPLSPTFTWTSCVGLGDSLGLMVNDLEGMTIYLGGPLRPISETSWTPGLLVAGHEHVFDIAVFAGTSGQPYARSTAGGDAFEYYDLLGFSNTVSFTTTPEPATLSLLALGGAALVARRKRN